MATMTTSTEKLEHAAESAGLDLFGLMSEYQYEQIVMCHEPYTGLKAIICVHNTTLGPALGGIRMWPYETEQEAIVDAMRLARAMTFKAAVAGLNLGGGKTVVIGDARADKSEMLFRALGRFIDTLNGRYIAAEDVGTATEDMEYIAMETPYVTGIDFVAGGSGDPSPMTAYGVYQGIRACAKQAYGSDSLRGRKIAVQGTGNVGGHLCDLLAEAGAELWVTDINEEGSKAVAERTGGTWVEPDSIYDVECDIFTPCALGGVINPDTIDRLTCSIVAGAANNVLLDDAMGEELHKRGILYAPDYVINAGGLINVSEELGGYNEERARKRVGRVYNSLSKILELAVHEQIPPYKAAEAVALERIKSVRPIADVYTGRSRTAWQHQPIALQASKK